MKGFKKTMESGFKFLGGLVGSMLILTLAVLSFKLFLWSISLF